MVQLRQRKARVSYAALASLSGDDNPPEDGPRTAGSTGPDNDSDDSASAFSVHSKGHKESSEEISDEISDVLSAPSAAESASESDLVMAQPARTRNLKATTTQKASSRVDMVYAPTNFSTRKPFLDSSKLTANASVSHATAIKPRSLFIPPGFPKRRLTRQPMLFGESDAQSTDASIDQVSLDDAWSKILSPGPVWQLLEDRGWYKECAAEVGVGEGPALDLRSTRQTRKTKAKEIHSTLSPGRPIVYHNVKVDMAGVSVFTLDEAAPYLPARAIKCSFGALGAQTELELGVFQNHRTRDFFTDEEHRMRMSHVFNAGGPVWSVDWCPISDESSNRRGSTQYIAVGALPSREHRMDLGSRVVRPSPACTQIWALHPSKSSKMESDELDCGETTCEMVLCTDSGPAHSLKWCPLPCHDSWNDLAPKTTRKLGILGGVFQDGTISIYVVPDPEDIRSQNKTLDGTPIFVHLREPAIRIELEETTFWSFDWANSETIVGGCTNGTVATFQIKDFITGNSEAILPSYYSTVHQAAIRSIAWIKVPPHDATGEPLALEDPTLICSVGYDGEIFLTDVKEGVSAAVARHRDILQSVVFSPWCGGPILAEYTTIKRICLYSFAMGRQFGIGLTKSPIWSLAVSDFHPFVASTNADGSLEIVNAKRVNRKNYNVVKLVHKIYQMDYNRKLDAYRMLEDFLPTEFHLSRSATKGPADADIIPSDSAISSWPSGFAIHCAAWNPNGLNKAQLLVSGTASGLCRIDSLWGWLGGEDEPLKELDTDDD